MNDAEFYEIFKTLNTNDLRIPGFEHKRNARDIPKSFLINSFFNQRNKKFNALKYVYDHYQKKGQYNNRKYDSYGVLEKVIEELTVDNYNEILIWLLSNQNEDFRNKGCEFISSEKFDKMISNNKITNKNVVIESEPVDVENKLEKLTNKNIELKKENEELKSKIKDIEFQNITLSKNIQICKASNSELHNKLKRLRLNYGR